MPPMLFLITLTERNCRSDGGYTLNIETASHILDSFTNIYRGCYSRCTLFGLESYKRTSHFITSQNFFSHVFLITLVVTLFT